VQRSHNAIPIKLRGLLFAKYINVNIQFLKAVEGSGDFECYFDGSKFLVRLELLRNHIDNTKVVHLMRDPRGYLHSCMKRGENNYKKILDRWFRYNSIAHNYKQVLPKNDYHLVRYEELIKDPLGVLSKIQKFIGLEVIDLQATYINNLKDIHVIGNKMKNTFKNVKVQSMKWDAILQKNQLSYISKKYLKNDWITDCFQ
jgi:hypothetical protein